MNKYTILLYSETLGEFVDISKYVETNMVVSDRADESLDFSSFNITHIKADSIDGFDFGDPIKPWTPCLIDINDGEEIFRMYTSDTSRSIIGKGIDKLYTHTIGLIEASKALWAKPIPDMSITQPSSALFSAAVYTDMKNDRIEVNNTQQTITFKTVNKSLDTSKIEGNTIKGDGSTKFNLNFSISAINKQFNAGKFNLKNIIFGSNTYRNAEGLLEVAVYANNTKIHQQDIIAAPGVAQPIDKWYSTDFELKNPIDTVEYFEINRVPTGTETITVKVKTKGSKWEKVETGAGSSSMTSTEDTLDVEIGMTPYIESNAGELAPEKTYLDEVVDKVLNLIDITDRNDTTDKYYFDESSAAEVSRVLSPDLTFQSYTAWDALEKIARIVNSIPTIDSDDYRRVKFVSMDEKQDLKYAIAMFNDETRAYTLDDHVQSYQLNASNTIEEDSLSSVKIEPYIGGWLSTRADSDKVSQVKEDNSTYKVRQSIYRVHKVFIKGVGVKITNGSEEKIIYGQNGNYWDISERVIEAARWNILPNGTANGSALERTSKLTKGNHLYYEQGGQYIKGLGYKTEELEGFLSSKVAPRALMETIMTVCQLYLDSADSPYGGYEVQPIGALTNTPEKAIQGNFELFKGVLAQVQYIPMAEVRSRVFKYNAVEDGASVHKYLNEQDRLNDMKNLGEYARKSINKRGNKEYTVSGTTSRYANIPRLGYGTTDGLYISARDIALNRNLIDYTLTLSENFLIQNNHIGVNSAYRQFEVPEDDTVLRQDKYVEHILLSQTPGEIDYTILEDLGKKKLVNNFTSQTTDTIPISHGVITIDNNDRFDMPLNAYGISTTTTIQTNMDTNYSAGPYKYDESIGALEDEFIVQSYTRYTNQFGQLNTIKLDVLDKGKKDNTESDANAYPALKQESLGSIIGSLDIDVYKDARERYGLSIDLAYLSNDKNIRVFPGISKYNSYVQDKEDVNLKLVLLDYIPSINDLELRNTGYTVLDDQATMASHPNGYYGVRFANVQIPANSDHKGYALVSILNDETMELVYFVETEIKTTVESTRTFPTVWFIPTKRLNDRLIPNMIPTRHTVQYNSNGGTPVLDEVVYHKTKIDKETPKKEGKEFGGWYTDPTLTNLYLYNPVEEDVQLYAKWNDISTILHKWVETSNNILDFSVTPEIEVDTCPYTYSQYLPDANNYEIGTIISVTPLRRTREGEDGDRYGCTTKYFTVIN